MTMTKSCTARRSRFRVALVAILGCLSGVSARAQEPFPGLDAYITKAMADWKMPGLAVAIVRNDSVLWAKGYGVRTFGSNDRVDDKTLFEIGSSSKSFTATIVAMLVTDGKMRWDDRLTRYLPTFQLYDPVANAEVTVRDALTHRAGLSRAELSWMYAGIGRDEVLRRARFLKPSFPFRSRWQYQNVMFLAAGEAAGRAASSTWEDLVQRRIFEPLGMARSLPLAPKDRSGVTNLATPHATRRDTVYTLAPMAMDNIAPAGSIVSTAYDMAQYLRFQLGDGTFNGKRLVSAAALRQTHTPQMLMGGGEGGGGGEGDSLTRFSTYGMGWMVQDYRRNLMWQHGGNTDGMTTAMGMLPDSKFGVVVLSNMYGAQLPGLLMRYIFDRQLGVPVRDLSAEALTRVATQRRRADSTERAQAALRVAGAQPPLPISAYAGSYTDSLYGEATVSETGGKLVMQRGDLSAPLEYWNANNFRWGRLNSAAVTQLFVKFDVAPDGKVTSLSFGLGPDTAYMARKAPVRAAALRP
ncbi:MAG TPA: serine hydrolase [Gemmatimonadaceae bacterium]|nr:serine hydrolase [Gemmatimonadaceae bacterium]